MNGQLDLELGSALKKLTEDAAKIAGVSSEEAFESILEAIKRDAEWRLKAAEIFQKTASMDFLEIYQNYADAVGVEFNELENHQKANALINYVLHEEH